MKKIVFLLFGVLATAACATRTLNEGAETQDSNLTRHPLYIEFQRPLYIEQRGRNDLFLHKDSVKQTKLSKKQVFDFSDPVLVEEYGVVDVKNRSLIGTAGKILGGTEPFRIITFSKVKKQEKKTECFFKMVQQDSKGLIQYKNCDDSDMNAQLVAVKDKSENFLHYELVVYPQRKDGHGTRVPDFLESKDEYIERYPLNVVPSSSIDRITYTANWAKGGKQLPISLAQTKEQDGTSREVLLRYYYQCPANLAPFQRPSFSVQKHSATNGGTGALEINRKNLIVPCADSRTYFALPDERYLWGLASILSEL